MDDYKKKAHQKYLEQKKIKIEEDEQLKREEEEKNKKIKEEQAKKEFYIQEQILIIEESIETYKIDKTDDNILMILTIINGALENIASLWTQENIKDITNLIIAFSNDVDSNNDKRPKGLNTIANVKILKDGFEKIFKLLNLNVEIQTNDTDNDAEIAKKLEETLNPKKKIQPLKEKTQIIIEEPDINYEEPDVHYEEPDDDSEYEETEDDSEYEETEDIEELDDEKYARKLHDEINNPKKEESKKAPILSNKYKGLNCDDFINALMNDKI